MKTRTVVLAGLAGCLLAMACVLGLSSRAGVAYAASGPRAQALADSGFITITVKAGDNLAKYTVRFGVSPVALIQANSFKDPNLIFPGQTVVIPVARSTTPSLTTPFYYTVVSGDTLGALASRFEMDLSVISAANGLQNGAIALGQVLLIPAGPHSHIALKGETLKSIAARYGIPVSVLISNNPGISNPDLIFSGQPIFVPVIYGAQPVPLSGNPAPTAVPGASATPGPTPTSTPAPSATPVGANNFIHVTVHSGESFVTYVERYGVSPHRLRDANQQIADPNTIFPGQIVIVPVIASFTPSRTTPFFYTVQGGDTAASIAAKFEFDAVVVSAANPGASFSAGSTILLPAGPHLYTVRQGDNLGIIAGRYATTPDFILTGNKLPDPGAIFPGELIYIPLQKDKIPVAYN